MVDHGQRGEREGAQGRGRGSHRRCPEREGAIGERGEGERRLTDDGAEDVEAGDHTDGGAEDR
jgi:hypothetical protein